MTDYDALLSEVEDQYPTDPSWAEQRQALPAPRWVDGNPQVADHPPRMAAPPTRFVFNGVDISDSVRSVTFDPLPNFGVNDVEELLRWQHEGDRTIELPGEKQ